MRELTIAGRRIVDHDDPWVIAEVGHNHQGAYWTATRLLRRAADAGADAVKLQKRNNPTLFTDEAYNRPYDSENAFGPTYGKHREALELGEGEYRDLYEVALSAGIKLFATPFDQASANFLMRVLDPPCFKIASADIINYELIDYVASLGKPIIISTGAATEGDVDRAMHVAYHHTQQVALLQCTAMYPAPAGSLNLNVITTYRERYPSTVIGYSSHYSGIADALLAYALGARIIEKHFTLDRTMKGSDHVFSLEPDGFKKMVSYLKNARLMLGSETKEVLPEEAGMIDKMRKTTRWWQGLEVKV